MLSQRNVWILLISVILAGCSLKRSTLNESGANASRGSMLDEEPGYNLTPNIYTPQTFTAHADYVAMTVNYDPILALSQELKRRRNISFKSRGEAHITVITPPEMKVLRRRLSLKEINGTARAQLKKAAFEVVCIGQGEKEIDGNKEQTYFVVVYSEDLQKLREELARQYLAKGGSPEDFEPRQYYPHITLGFTKRDLHFEDGVKKDQTACIAPIKVIQ